MTLLPWAPISHQPRSPLTRRMMLGRGSWSSLDANCRSVATRHRARTIGYIRVGFKCLRRDVSS